MTMLNFSGRRALILGGSCELAVCLAEAMIPMGLCPMLTYRSGKGRQRIHEHLDGLGSEYRTIFLDLASNDPVAAFIDHPQLEIDYLVDFAQEDFERWVASADSNAIHSFFHGNIAARSDLVQFVARKMLAKRRGRMVYISSAAAGRPNPGQGFYAAAKMAAEALYRNLGLELANRGITTVNLRPGYIDSGRGRRYLAKQEAAAPAKVPIGRALKIKEVVDTILFLLSDSAMGFNATTLTMDGGMSACK